MLNSHTTDSTSPVPYWRAFKRLLAAAAAADGDAARRDTILQHLIEIGVVPAGGDPGGVLFAAEDVVDRALADKRITVTREESQNIGRWKRSKQFGLEEQGLLLSHLCGPIRQIRAITVYSHLFNVAVAPYRKARLAQHLRKPRRARTEAELRGLAIGNARRHEEALARRRARAQKAAES
jgi:hypothetical protein